MLKTVVQIEIFVETDKKNHDLNRFKKNIYLKYIYIYIYGLMFNETIHFFFFSLSFFFFK